MVVEELLQSFISVVDTQLLKCIELKGNEIENDSEFLNEKYVLHVNKCYRKQKGQSRDICNIGHTRRKQKKQCKTQTENYNYEQRAPHQRPGVNPCCREN